MQNSSYDSDAPLESINGERTQEQNVIVAPVYNLFDNFPQAPVIVMDQNMLIKKVLEDEFEAKRWLSNNAQHLWWQGEPREIDVNRYPASSFGLRW